MILFLDNDRLRTAAFRRWYPKAECFETAAAIIARLQRARLAGEEIAVMYLDHDLGGRIYVDSDEPETGMEVVRWLERMEARTPRIGETIIHSHNYTASVEMRDRLLALGYNAKLLPFDQLTQAESEAA
jgi:hypothetical protein